ncbi:MAG TPA: glycosyltransferase family 2 protein, partial [Oligoflexia bacterium]|nr:glycosyltransferase family 2 protein [Oligoflexia bacterium]
MNAPRTWNGLDIVLPVYNEELPIVHEALDKLAQVFSNMPDVTIIVVNDGSDKSFGLDSLAHCDGILYCEHEENRGYGAALKTGILAGRAPWIAIVDADGTYPIEELPKLLAQMEKHDMVIGARTGPVSEIPRLRRFPKSMLNLFASLMAGVFIPDLNSGMRVFSRQLCYYLWGFFPAGFSFTSTLTMGAQMGGFRTKNVPINYYKRSGQSSIRPVHDTIRFFRIVCRLGLIFYPMKLFAPVAVLLFAVGFVKAVFRDYWLIGTIGATSQTTMLAGLEIFMIGLIAHLIV